jgi:hypothetical protein
MKPCLHPVVLKVHRGLANNEALQGKRLSTICRENKIDTGNVYPYLRFEINSDKADEARKIIFAKSNIDYAEAMKLAEEFKAEKVATGS